MIPAPPRLRLAAGQRSLKLATEFCNAARKLYRENDKDVPDQIVKAYKHQCAPPRAAAPPPRCPPRAAPRPPRGSLSPCRRTEPRAPSPRHMPESLCLARFLVEEAGTVEGCRCEMSGFYLDAELVLRFGTPSFAGPARGGSRGATESSVEPA